MVNQGKLLGHVVYEERLFIDLDRVKEIEKIPLTSKNKSMQLFLGKINFVRKFISDFSRIVAPINVMLKKDIQFSWYEEEKQYLHNIKKVIIIAPTLKNPYFSKYLIMYAYGAEKS